MGQYKLKNSSIKLSLAAKPFASGGEGNLYAITQPAELRQYVAKIYHAHKLTEIRERKITYLVEFPPMELEDKSVVWVKDALYEGQKFVGFIMPFIEGEKLEILCTLKIPTRLRHAWRRFDFKLSTDAADLRMKLCFNICAAIHQVHTTGRYILVDMKPDNIVIQPNGLVSIVDTDSVEVIEEGKSIFDAPVATPEYTPPERYQNLSYDPTGREEWDLFGLGVILYKLLFGIHPFAASSKFPHEHLASLSDKIEHGLFVHHPAKQDSFAIIPPPHKAFYTLDASLQALFMRCFIDGHHDPQFRPSAEEWCSTILLALNDEQFFKRYEHILGGVQRVVLPRFPRPSSKLELPSYFDGVDNLVQLNNTVVRRPAIQKPLQSQLKTFEVQQLLRLSFILWVAGLVMVFIIGTPVLGIMALAFILLKSYNNYKKEAVYEALQLNILKAKSIRQDYKDKVKKVRKLKSKFKWKTGRVLPKIEKLSKSINKEINELKDFLKIQDKEVAKLEKNAIIQYKELNRRYAEIAQKNRLVARLNDGEWESLFKIKAAIESSRKKAISFLTKEQPISEKHPIFLEGKIAVDSLIENKKIEISELIGTELTELEQEENEAIQKLFEPLQGETNLILNFDRLWKGKRQPSSVVRDKMEKEFQELGFLSILDIDKIDTYYACINLKNGTKVKFMEFFDSKTAIKNLRYWLDQTKHQLEFYDDEELKIKKIFEVKKKDLADKKRIELKGLGGLQKKELEKIKIAVQKEVLGTPFSNLQQEYETVVQYVEELESDCEQEEKELMQDYNQLYQDILQVSKLKITKTEEKIAFLKKELDYYDDKANKLTVQARYLEFKKELDELQQLIPKLEQIEFEQQQYKNITFSNYMKKLTGHF